MDEYKKIDNLCVLCGERMLYETPLRDNLGVIHDKIHFCSNCENARFVKKGQNFDALIFQRLKEYLSNTFPPSKEGGF